MPLHTPLLQAPRTGSAWDRQPDPAMLQANFSGIFTPPRPLVEGVQRFVLLDDVSLILKPGVTQQQNVGRSATRWTISNTRVAVRAMPSVAPVCCWRH